jgi:hypothetical protein
MYSGAAHAVSLMPASRATGKADGVSRGHKTPPFLVLFLPTTDRSADMSSADLRSAGRHSSRGAKRGGLCSILLQKRSLLKQLCITSDYA